MTNLLDFDTFHDGFITAALWSSTDDEGEPLDANYDASDFDDDSATNLEAIARHFWYRNACYLEAIAKEHGRFAGNHGYTLDALAGHDLWLTMCGHGAGFRDRDFYKVTSETLTDDDDEPRVYCYGDMFTKAAEAIGNVDLYTHDSKVFA